MKINMRLLFIFTAAVGVAQAQLSVSVALKVLKEYEPKVFNQLNKEAPTIIPGLQHRHRSFLGHAGKLLGGSALGFLSLAAFGALHNQYTVQVSKEYFSDGFHKRNMLGSTGKHGFAPWLYRWLEKRDSKPLWGGAWGLVAGGSMGVFVGPILAALAVLGPTVPVGGKHMAKAAFIGMLGAVGASMLGALKHRFFDKKLFNGFWAGNVAGHLPHLDKPTHERFFRAGTAHNMLYGAGTIAIALVALYTLGRRIYLEKRFRGRDKQTARDILTKLAETDENGAARAKVLQAVS